MQVVTTEVLFLLLLLFIMTINRFPAVWCKHEFRISLPLRPSVGFTGLVIVRCRGRCLLLVGLTLSAILH